MKFLIEGRREDLLQKYMSDFDIQVLDTVLNDPFTKSTNYKYADWIFKNLEFNSTPLAMEVLELVKQFDRIGKNLEIKDLNQYPDVVELRHAVETYTSKSQEKKVESEADKIYEDDRVLIVKPLSHAASCKYGMGTKWCTTQSSPGYFDKYTSGDSVLYYLMMKEFDISNKFYKIALHKTPREETWYDAQDTVMPPREVDVLKVGLGKKANKSIEEDFSKNKDKSIKELFDENKNFHVVVEKNLYGTKKPLVFHFSDPLIFNEVGNFVEITLRIYYGTAEEETLLESGFLKISYVKYSDSSYVFDIGYHPNDDFTPPVEIDSLWHMDFTFKLDPSDTSFDPFKRFCNILSSLIWNRLLKHNKNLQKYVLGDKKTWNPNRFSYGFTFQRKGLINKLVDYLDSGKQGNAIDFLLDSGVIRKGTYPSGEIYYLGKKGTIQPKGYFSSFFASAVRAGILSYERKNKKNILTKGPNFDDFKEGNLTAI